VNLKTSKKKMIKDLYIFIILILVIVIFGAISVKFFRPQNITNLLRNAAPIMFISGSITMLMISGNVDLSVGGNLSLSACLYVILLQNNMSYVAAVIIILIAGAVMGIINGFLVIKLRIASVIATLATMNLFWGTARLLVPEKMDLIKFGLPDNISVFARKAFFLGVPMAFYVALLGVIFLIFLQKRTVLGKYAAAIGGNRTAAELSGINVTKTLVILYIIAGVFSAAAGITRASYMKAGDPRAGIGMELDAIIAVLLGGTSFFGGSGSVLRTIVAAFVIICLTVGMSVIGVEPYWQMFIKGIVLISALVIDHVVKDSVTYTHGEVKSVK
jgi:ribose/xylose/arabinose/galactoside ABC-type transport system permease subunit